MDPYWGCDIGGMAGITEEILRQREELIFSWCEARQIPIAFALAGGYESKNLSKETLVRLHRLTIERAARVRF